MKKELMKIVGALALCVSSAAFAEEMPSVKPNGCKGPVLCPSFPIYGKDRDCCNMYGGHIDIGFIWEQPWIDSMGSVFTEILETSASPARENYRTIEQCFPYTFGVCASLGFSPDHDNWYVGAKFDWLSGTISNRTISNNNIGIITGKITFTGGASIALNANLDIYMLDVLISRGSYHSTCFSFEPYAGVKALWYNGETKVTGGQNGDGAETNYITGESQDKFSAWGVGPMFGFNSEYYFTHTLSIFSDSDVAVLYGDGSRMESDISTTSAGVEHYIKNKSSSNQDYFIPIRSILGIKLATFCMEDRHYVAVKIGYDARVVQELIFSSPWIASSGLYVNFIWDF